jgi:hypothetical protein
MTIAFAVDTEKELDQLEARHICPERALAELQKQGKAIESRSHRASLS